MNITAIENIWHENGWDAWFDVLYQEHSYRFSVQMDTLLTPGLRSRTKQTFPEIFEANVPTILLVCDLLIRSGRLNPNKGIGGTEILPHHIVEVMGREA
jgi:hypothetical protein